MTTRLKLTNRDVEIYHSPDKNWQADKIYIFDPNSQVTGKEKKQIIEYLYLEGFIEDRRTSSEVVRTTL